MNTQNKTIKEILSLYDVILENKNVTEASDVYDDVDFENIGQGNPASDNINTSLLQDVQSAAKSAGLKVNITTAVSGHDKGTRHETGDAVDVARINGIGSGGATNSTNGNAKFRELGNKLKDALVSMGYVWNTESGNPKSVLWQTNTGETILITYIFQTQPQHHQRLLEHQHRLIQQRILVKQRVPRLIILQEKWVNHY